MTQQGADHRQAQAASRADAGIAVTQIVQPDVFQVGRRAHPIPGLAERHDGLAGPATGKHMVDARLAGKGAKKVNCWL